MARASPCGLRLQSVGRMLALSLACANSCTASIILARWTKSIRSPNASGRWRMITEQLVAEAIVRSRGDKNAYRIASHLSSMGYTLGTGDMHAIRDILGEAHP